MSASVRSKKYGWLMPDWTNRVKGSESLDMYKRSFWGVLPQIWSTLPHELVREGIEKGWPRIKSRCTKCIIHGALPEPKLNNELNADAPLFIPANKQNVKNEVIPNLNKAR